MRRPYYIDQILPFVDKEIIKVFTGIRRCGKSNIMAMVRDVLAEKGRLPKLEPFYTMVL